VVPLPQDLNQFYAQYKSIEPWLKQKQERTDMTKENLQTKEDRAKLVRQRRVTCADARPVTLMDRPGRDGAAGRAVRVHLVRMLLDVVPKLLVEPGQVPGAGRAHGRLPLDGRQPRTLIETRERTARVCTPPDTNAAHTHHRTSLDASAAQRCRTRSRCTGATPS
jgi:hypothetical protein